MAVTTTLAEFDSSPGAERPFPPGTVNGRLLEAILRHRHYILRVENGVIRDLLGPLMDAQKDILGTLAELAAREDALSDFQRLRRSRLLELNRRIEAAIGFTMQETLSRAHSNLQKVARREIEIQNRLLRREIPDGITLDLIGPEAARVEMLISQPLGGKRWARRMQENYRGLTREMKRSLSTSVLLGEGMDEAAARLRGKVTKLGINRSVLIARSEIQRVANAAATETYRSNADVIKGMQVVETLDDRTCLICAVKDGQVLELGSGDVPPYHAGCRGFTAPVVRSLQEMGLSELDFPPSTRASMDGQVAADLSYTDWFRRQPEDFQRDYLGPERFRRYAAGDLEIKDMVRDLKVLAIDELPSMSLGVN